MNVTKSAIFVLKSIILCIYMSLFVYKYSFIQLFIMLFTETRTSTRREGWVSFFVFIMVYSTSLE